MLECEERWTWKIGVKRWEARDALGWMVDVWCDEGKKWIGLVAGMKSVYGRVETV